MKKHLLIFGISLLLIACGNKSQTDSSLKEGKWYGEFLLDNHAIPFLFEVKSDLQNSAPIVTLINGEERVELTETKIVKDSIYIPVSDYDTEFRGTIHQDTLRGVFLKLFTEADPGIAFKAIRSNSGRFPVNGEPGGKLAGKWDTEFISEQGSNNHVGNFQQTGNHVSGSILTKTGDFRYLDGVIDQDGFRLSSFSGLNPYLIQGTFTDTDHFEGEFITPRSIQQIKGTRNENATLPDPYSLTEFNSTTGTLSFQLPNPEGDIISLADDKYKNKVVVISILGSWCPNCLDEINFLVPWYLENQHRGVEIIGLAFERKSDPEEGRRVLNRLKEKYQIPYELLFGGKTTDSKHVLPEIARLISYPTTIFIDKEGVVRKIHAGFNGPATGEFYEEFKENFNHTINSLLGNNQ